MAGSDSYENAHPGRIALQVTTTTTTTVTTTTVTTTTTTEYLAPEYGDAAFQKAKAWTLRIFRMPPKPRIIR